MPLTSSYEKSDVNTRNISTPTQLTNRVAYAKVHFMVFSRPSWLVTVPRVTYSTTISPLPLETRILPQTGLTKFTNTLPTFPSPFPGLCSLQARYGLRGRQIETIFSEKYYLDLAVWRLRFWKDRRRVVVRAARRASMGTWIAAGYMYLGWMDT